MKINVCIIGVVSSQLLTRYHQTRVPTRVYHDWAGHGPTEDGTTTKIIFKPMILISFLKLTCWCSINAKLKGIPESPVCCWQSPTLWHPYPGHQSWTWPVTCHRRHERYNCSHHCNSTSCCHRYCHQQEMLGLNCSDLAFWVQSSAFGFWIQISFSV